MAMPHLGTLGRDDVMTDYDREYIADDIYGCLNAEWTPSHKYECRSKPNSDIVDVKLNGQWYRVSSERIDTPVCLCSEACDECSPP